MVEDLIFSCDVKTARIGLVETKSARSFFSKANQDFFLLDRHRFVDRAMPFKWILRASAVLNAIDGRKRPPGRAIANGILSMRVNIRVTICIEADDQTGVRRVLPG